MVYICKILCTLEDNIHSNRIHSKKLWLVPLVEDLKVKQTKCPSLGGIRHVDTLSSICKLFHCEDIRLINPNFADKLNTVRLDTDVLLFQTNFHT